MVIFKKTLMLTIQIKNQTYIIGDMVSNEKLQPILIELFSRSRKLTIISTHIYSAWFAVLHCILSTSNRSFFYFLFVSGVWQIFFPKTTSIFWTLFVPNSYMLRFCIDGLINCFKHFELEFFSDTRQVC